MRASCIIHECQNNDDDDDDDDGDDDDDDKHFPFYEKNPLEKFPYWLLHVIHNNNLCLVLCSFIFFLSLRNRLPGFRFMAFTRRVGYSPRLVLDNRPEVSFLVRLSSFCVQFSKFYAIGLR